MNLKDHKTNTLLGFILLLALALRVPGWFTEDEKTRFRLFEPDEYQHVQIAVYQIQCIDFSLLTDWDVERKLFNARGYGIQLGTLAWLNYRLWGMPLTIENLILLGRALSTFYAILLVLLVYLLAQLLFRKREIALMAALLMAICDLNVTYSHYALPASAYVFWIYLFLFWTVLLFKRLRGNTKAYLLYVALLSFTAAASFASKFDFIPFFIGLFIFLFLALRRKINWVTSLRWSLVFLVFFVLSFGLLTTFNFSLERIEYSFWDLYRQNKDVIPQDNHWIYNPVAYLFALIAGTSLPLAIGSGLGMISIWKEKLINSSWDALEHKVESIRYKDINQKSKSKIDVFSTDRSFHFLLFTFFTRGVLKRPAWLVILILLILEFGVRWSSDIPFVRRANIFMPLLTLLAAYGWHQIKHARSRKYFGLVMAMYTLGLCMVSQSNAWLDTRYEARDYLREEQADRRIKYGSYAYALGAPRGVSLKEQEEILVLHETSYSRYWRSFTTPFRIPECCEEVYHCITEECELMQSILSGENQDYKLIKQFRTREWFPERILFKAYLGNFETFLGDVLILERYPVPDAR